MKIKYFLPIICFGIISLSTFAQEKAELELIADNFVSPLTLVESPDDSKRYFIVDQVGVISVYIPGKGLQQEPFLNIKDKIVPLNDAHEERGLLGLAFHPDYKRNGRFFVYYSAPLSENAPENWNHTSHISEFKVSQDRNKADRTSEKIIMKVDQPQDNHNAGTLAFGPDKYLYISLGDGGGANDIDMGHVPDWYEKNGGGNGQDVEQNLLGSILRIDINSQGSPYAIPEDNPFVGKDGMDEIYAYGLRNPYRFSFDPKGNHDLIAGDAGQVLWEEINVVTKGGNYGWNVKEGTHCFDAYNNDHKLEECPEEDKMGQPLIDPVLQFKQGGTEHGGKGLVVIGGHVYRGEEIKVFDGKYFFGTWSLDHGTPAGAIYMTDMKGTGEHGMWEFNQLDIIKKDNVTGLGHFLLGFGQNNSGEIFVLTSDEAGPVGNTGKVYKLVHHH